MLEVIMPIEAIPDGSQVRKITGVKIYTVKDMISIYEGKDKKEIPGDGCKFLIGADGSINVYANKKFVWITTLDNLNSLFEERND